MRHIVTCLLTLLFSLSGPVMKENAEIWHSTFGAKAPALRNPNVYEALYEAPITGTTRAAHPTSANQFLANQLGNDAQLEPVPQGRRGGLDWVGAGSGRRYEGTISA